MPPSKQHCETSGKYQTTSAASNIHHIAELFSPDARNASGVRTELQTRVIHVLPKKCKISRRRSKSSFIPTCRNTKMTTLPKKP
eukprot:5909416-Pyramimonas_sp.AAC.1